MAPDNTREVTLGEVSRGLAKVERALVDLAAQVGSSSASDAAVAATINSLRERVEHLENWQTWAMRIVVGAVLTAILGLVLLDPIR